MAEGRWRISVTAPDWGQDHLSSEAVVAFVDGELAPGPHHRATRHLGECGECASQVRAQGQARSALRAARCPALPSALLSTLRSIPQDTALPGPPAGLAMTADGQLVSIVRPDRFGPPAARRATSSREPAPAPRTAHPISPAPPAPGPERRPSVARRRRLSTGVAVSGLALGALALGVPAAGGPAVPGPAPDQRVLGGSVLGGQGLGGQGLGGQGLGNPALGTPALGGSGLGGTVGGAANVVDARLRLSPSSLTPSPVTPSWVVPTWTSRPAATDLPEPGPHPGRR